MKADIVTVCITDLVSVDHPVRLGGSGWLDDEKWKNRQRKL